MTTTSHAGRGYSIRHFLSPPLFWSRSSRSLRPFSQFTSLARSSLSHPSLESSRLSKLSSLSEKSPSLVFRSTSSNPYHNLGIEDYLLRHSAHTSHILFLYANRPCVVIGRNQNPWLECDLRLIQRGLPTGDTGSNDEEPNNEVEYRTPIDLVRRRSGGGTVFHDEGNLNYTVIAPNNTSWRKAEHAEMVVRALGGIQERDFKAEIKVNERNDIVMRRNGESEWLKISGSAFKIIRGRALHHGTLLYSSPHLGSISGLLKGPGKDLIRARGVESVRSKVGNLQWTEDLKEREELRDIIIEAITNEFNAMYGQDGSVSEVGDEDVNAAGNEKIIAGVQEMMSNEWRFEQTPRFEFESNVRSEADRGLIAFTADRGVIQTLSSRIERSGEEVFEHPQVHLHTVQNWQKTLKSVMGEGEALSKPWEDKVLMEQLTLLFPPWSSGICGGQSRSGASRST